MTFIEFFEKDAIENICSALAAHPDQVVLVGHSRKELEKAKSVYEELFETWGKPVRFRPLPVSRNNMDEILSELEKVVSGDDTCIFDLTGGEDLYLVAVGMLRERFPEKVRMHRFNIANGNIYDCDQDGITLTDGIRQELSVDENIRLYGGRVVYEDNRPGTTRRWDMNEEFLADIDRMWEICRCDVREWNAMCSALAAVRDVCEETGSPLLLMAKMSKLQGELDGFCVSVIRNGGILRKLQRSGILHSFSADDDYLTVTFKNEQLRDCLTKAGLLLELKIYLEMFAARNKDGTPCYNDVNCGVFLDWDGVVHAPESGVDTENEIDVLAMRGMVPVFVSCKNGKVNMEELYKLNTVAKRFGGKYAKMVLVATSLRGRNYELYLRQRAADMGIQILDDEILSLERGELQKKLRSV